MLGIDKIAQLNSMTWLLGDSVGQRQPQEASVRTEVGITKEGRGSHGFFTVLLGF